MNISNIRISDTRTNTGDQEEIPTNRILFVSEKIDTRIQIRFVFELLLSMGTGAVLIVFYTTQRCCVEKPFILLRVIADLAAHLGSKSYIWLRKTSDARNTRWRVTTGI